jgi:hypothetical protein
MVRLANLELYHVWMWRAKNDVVKDDQYDNFKHVHIQWWVQLKKGARNDRKLLLNKWKCNLANWKQWVNISSIQLSFPTISNVTINNSRLMLFMQPRPNKTLMQFIMRLLVHNYYFDICIILFFKCNLMVVWFQKKGLLMLIFFVFCF